jgi:hypothetical protein
LARGHLLPRYFKGETKVLQALFIVLVPAGILYLSRRNKFIGLVGPILLSYIAGILIGNLGLELNDGISMQISEIAVPVAIPFILYSVDIKKWLKMTNKTIKSFMLVITSAIISSVAAALLLGDTVPEAAKISGMLAGCYTGGTPNLVLVGLAARINNDTLVLVNGADIVVGGLYFLFIIGLAPSLTKKILPPFIKEQEEQSTETVSAPAERKRNIWDIVIAFSVMLLNANQSWLKRLDEPYNTREASIGRHISEIITGWKGSVLESIWNTVLVSGKSCYLPEYRYIGLKKGLSYWNISLTPIYEDSILAYFVEITHDVTETVMNRDKIRFQRDQLFKQFQQFETVVENMSDALFVLYPDPAPKTTTYSGCFSGRGL